MYYQEVSLSTLLESQDIFETYLKFYCIMYNIYCIGIVAFFLQRQEGRHRN